MGKRDDAGRFVPGTEPATGRPFAKGPDPRRGKGAQVGAPNAGRRAAIIREQAREAFAARIRTLEKIADDPKAKHADRIRAMETLARFGLGTTFTQTDDDGNAVPTPAAININLVRPKGEE